MADVLPLVPSLGSFLALPSFPVLFIPHHLFHHPTLCSRVYRSPGQIFL